MLSLRKIIVFKHVEKGNQLQTIHLAFLFKILSPCTVIGQDSSEKFESLWHRWLVDYKCFQITISLNTWYGKRVPENLEKMRRLGTG